MSPANVHLGEGDTPSGTIGSAKLAFARELEMGILLAHGDDETFEVTLLDDVAPDWQGIKVMAVDGQGTGLPVGATVDLRGDTDRAGTYTVARTLSPAAPRNWRMYLVQASSAPASEAAPPERATLVASSDYGERYFELRVSNAAEATIRRTVKTYRVSYSRMSSEIKRLTKAGGKILSIVEIPQLGKS